MNYPMTELTTPIIILMKLKERIKRVILSTLKALNILIDLKADNFELVLPIASSIMLTATTAVSNRFITSEKNPSPYARTLSDKSATKIIVNT